MRDIDEVLQDWFENHQFLYDQIQECKQKFYSRGLQAFLQLPNHLRHYFPYHKK
jgi:hypothetical protein